MENNWASENLQTIRLLMERSALYRRALAPIMLTVGAIGSLAGLIAGYLEINSQRTFVLFWLVTAAVALGASFILVRRQSRTDKEPFWSPPTRRVALGLAPPLAVGFLLAIFIYDTWSLPGLWMILYGCALHSAGFFMARGIRWLGIVFLFCGLAWLCREEFLLNFPLLWQLNVVMAAIFGGLHLAYGIYLYFTEKKKVAA